ncbi:MULTISPECIES: 5'/3'-nucleotidase SurE [Persicobacter]|uniref:5'-nucleotidase SurE n=1 Tax=Persicobacter diffluens TaxID=981 RepID=A0AAN5AJR6_9BACT|nr:5'/3'-nucleotidase SurE [Persicobacter sp. CCB-QB2]GJM61137.1 5'-nucleotidase SurE [Persicobacter diffluens]
MSKNKPLILVTNDDGITSPGIRVLVETMQEIGEVVVVAPDSPQSGMGHAITIGEVIRVNEEHLFEGVKAFSCSGTPADCVKIAKSEVLKGRKLDLVVSGINHGANTSISVLYSGTMSAAIEGAVEGIPAIGFSLCEYGWDADFSHVKKYVQIITEKVLENGLPKEIALNVNFPMKQDEPIKGIKVCRQARARWQEEFDKRNDPMGRTYYWMAGQFKNLDKGVDNDVWAIDNNYVAVVPTQFDLSAYHAVNIINEWGL